MASAVDLSENHQGEYRTQTIAMTALGLFFVILRFTARWKKGLSFGWDDYTMVLSVMFLFATCGLNLASETTFVAIFSRSNGLLTSFLPVIHYGLGRHAAALPTQNVIMIAKLLVAFECVYCTTVGIIKVSILLMYARIFPTRNFHIASYIIGSIAVGWVIAIICVSVFQCNPIAKAWNVNLPGACINLKGSFIGNAVPNILTDIAILSMPVHVVWGLHANLTHRLSVIALFLLGSFVVFTSAYRFSTLFEFDPVDTPWTLAKACTWCFIECSSGIISACLPSLRPLFMIISSKFASTIGSSHANTNDFNSLAHRSGGNLVLRPPGELISKQRMQLEVSHADDASGDEVPLNSIRVQRDVTWQETTYNSSGTDV